MGADIQQQLEDLYLSWFVKKVDHIEWEKQNTWFKDFPRVFLTHLFAALYALLCQVNKAHTLLHRFVKSMYNTVLDKVIHVRWENVH